VGRAVNLNDVMNQLGTQLDTIAGLRVYPYPADTVAPPAAILGLPDGIEFDATYGRGSDEITIPVLVVVGRASDRAARDKLAEYCDGAGAKSIKQVIEAGTYTAFDTVRVARAEFDFVRIAGADYLAALFDLNLTGSG
jgi:hypothetical protein